MNILSIGNSFSQDAQRYLHQIAKADGVDLQTFNLMIGSCSLYRHYKNMLCDEKGYTLEMNGQSTGFFVSLKEALTNREWDVVTIQQVSGDASKPETFQPYLCELIAFIKKCVPKAKIAVHQTWAYENGSQLLQNVGFASHAEMFQKVESAYRKAMEDIGADMLIPSGKLFCKLVEEEGLRIHRDGFHAKLGFGRYALGLLWYQVLTGNDISGNAFCDFDETISADELEIIRKNVLQLRDYV